MRFYKPQKEERPVGIKLSRPVFTISVDRTLLTDNPVGWSLLSDNQRVRQECLTY
ncbi:MAG: hypothetical protein P9X24_18610 [Candidatus Hatepunaea meridiana]|nr:hypothetical protein [Candidatus Hatepunaea meridiana]